mmetsp:Transcript_5826/g.13099  ORF Transcript_5826/g.13099 Transcript_5826/m.13099 type:complete len:347 (-) Transcript_5826:224-1264(-)
MPFDIMRGGRSSLYSRTTMSPALGLRSASFRIRTCAFEPAEIMAWYDPTTVEPSPVPPAGPGPAGPDDGPAWPGPRLFDPGGADTTRVWNRHERLGWTTARGRRGRWNWRYSDRARSGLTIVCVYTISSCSTYSASCAVVPMACLPGLPVLSAPPGPMRLLVILLPVPFWLMFAMTSPTRLCFSRAMASLFRCRISMRRSLSSLPARPPGRVSDSSAVDVTSAEDSRSRRRWQAGWDSKGRGRDGQGARREETEVPAREDWSMSGTGRGPLPPSSRSDVPPSQSTSDARSSASRRGLYAASRYDIGSSPPSSCPCTRPPCRAPSRPRLARLFRGGGGGRNVRSSQL